MKIADFLDTNLFVYAGSTLEDDKEKSKIARAIILANPFAISAQVIQEFISIALRKPQLGIGETGIDKFLELASLTKVQPITLELVSHACELRRKHQLSHWDSTIITAALELGCTTLYSEDLAAAQRFGSLQIVNPFAT
jgi:predicted nucleic acid-binding protein